MARRDKGSRNRMHRLGNVEHENPKTEIGAICSAQLHAHFTPPVPAFALVVAEDIAMDRNILLAIVGLIAVLGIVSFFGSPSTEIKTACPPTALIQHNSLRGDIKLSPMKGIIGLMRLFDITPQTMAKALVKNIVATEPGIIVVDVGAHEGQEALLALNQRCQSRVLRARPAELQEDRESHECLPRLSIALWSCW